MQEIFCTHDFLNINKGLENTQKHPLLRALILLASQRAIRSLVYKGSLGQLKVFLYPYDRIQILFEPV